MNPAIWECLLSLSIAPRRILARSGTQGEPNSTRRCVIAVYVRNWLFDCGVPADEVLSVSASRYDVFWAYRGEVYRVPYPDKLINFAIKFDERLYPELIA